MADFHNPLSCAERQSERQMAKKPSPAATAKNVQTMLRKSGMPTDSKVTITPSKKK
jgi:hypothetical protein